MDLTGRSASKRHRHTQTIFSGLITRAVNVMMKHVAIFFTDGLKFVSVVLANKSRRAGQISSQIIPDICICVHILYIHRGPPFRRHFLRLSCHSIRWLWHSCDWPPTFERISHYTLYITFRFNFQNVRRQPLIKSAYIIGPHIYMTMWLDTDQMSGVWFQAEVLLILCLKMICAAVLIIISWN
jgi:hypothetical protein